MTRIPVSVRADEDRTGAVLRPSPSSTATLPLSLFKHDGAPSRSATPLHHTEPSAPTHSNRNRPRKLRDRNHFPKK